MFHPLLPIFRTPMFNDLWLPKSYIHRQVLHHPLTTLATKIIGHLARPPPHSETCQARPHPSLVYLLSTETSPIPRGADRNQPVASNLFHFSVQIRSTGRIHLTGKVCHRFYVEIHSLDLALVMCLMMIPYPIPELIRERALVMHQILSPGLPARLTGRVLEIYGLQGELLRVPE